MGNVCRLIKFFFFFFLPLFHNVKIRKSFLRVELRGAKILLVK